MRIFIMGSKKHVHLPPGDPLYKTTSKSRRGFRFFQGVGGGWYRGVADSMGHQKSSNATMPQALEIWQ